MDILKNILNELKFFAAKVGKWVCETWETFVSFLLKENKSGGKLRYPNIIIVGGAALICIAVIVIIIAVTSYAKPILDTEYNGISDDHVATQQDLDEFIMLMSGETGGDSDLSYDLESQIIMRSEISFEKNKYLKKTTEVNCTVTAPDVYSYVIENMEYLNAMDIDALYNVLVEYINSGNYDLRTVELTLPVTYKNGYLIVDSNNSEYKDAASDGMYSMLDAIVMQDIQQMVDAQSEHADDGGEQ